MPIFYREKQGYILKRLIAMQKYIFFLTNINANINFRLN